MKLLDLSSSPIMLTGLATSLVFMTLGDVTFGLWTGTFFVAVHLAASIFSPRLTIADVTHLCVMFVYFFLAPSLQYTNGTTFWGLPSLKDDAVISARIMTALYMLGFEVARVFAKGYAPAIKMPYKVRTPSSRTVFVTMLAVLIPSVIVLLSFRSVALQPRGEGRAYDISPMVLIFFSTLPKSFILSMAVISVFCFSMRKTAVDFVTLTMCAICCYYFANPVHTPRQHIFIAVVASVTVFFPSMTRVKLIIFFITVVGLTTVGPILNSISRDQYNGVETSTFPYSPDFDASFNVSALSQVFQDTSLGWGRYLLNAFSFPLPSTLKLFPDFDPLTSGAVRSMFDQSNIAVPPFLTAYLDFGFPGSLLIGYIAGLVMHRAVVWVQPSNRFRRPSELLLGAVIIGCYTPFVRGPIQGMGPFALTMVFCIFCTWRILSFFNSKPTS